MILARYKHSLVYCNKAVYALGGYMKSKLLTNKVERFSFATGEWSAVPRMNYER